MLNLFQHLPSTILPQKQNHFPQPVVYSGDSSFFVVGMTETCNTTLRHPEGSDARSDGSPKQTSYPKSTVLYRP